MSLGNHRDSAASDSSEPESDALGMKTDQKTTEYNSDGKNENSLISNLVSELGSPDRGAITNDGVPEDSKLIMEEREETEEDCGCGKTYAGIALNEEEMKKWQNVSPFIMRGMVKGAFTTGSHNNILYRTLVRLEFPMLSFSLMGQADQSEEVRRIMPTWHQKEKTYSDSNGENYVTEIIETSEKFKVNPSLNLVDEFSSFIQLAKNELSPPLKDCTLKLTQFYILDSENTKFTFTANFSKVYVVNDEEVSDNVNLVVGPDDDLKLIAKFEMLAELETGGQSNTSNAQIEFLYDRDGTLLGTRNSSKGAYLKEILIQ